MLDIHSLPKAEEVGLGDLPPLFLPLLLFLSLTMGKTILKVEKILRDNLCGKKS